MRKEETFRETQKALIEQGLMLCPILVSTTKCAYFVLSEQDVELKNLSVDLLPGTKALFGNWIELREIPTGNGKDIVNYYLEAMTCDRSVVKPIAELDKLKIDHYRTSTHIKTLVKRFIDTYKTYLKKEQIKDIIKELGGVK